MQASDVAAAPASGAAGIDADASPDQRVQRVLKFIVVTLAVLLFAGLLVAVARVIYLASAPVAQPATSALTPAAPMPAIRPEQSVALPQARRCARFRFPATGSRCTTTSARRRVSPSSTCRQGGWSPTSRSRQSLRAGRDRGRLPAG